jgi:hypothetical protein
MARIMPNSPETFFAKGVDSLPKGAILQVGFLTLTGEGGTGSFDKGSNTMSKDNKNTTGTQTVPAVPAALVAAKMTLGAKAPGGFATAVLEFPSIKEGTSVEEAVEIIRFLARGNDTAAAAFLRDAVERAQRIGPLSVMAWLKGKNREPGRKYTREEQKSLAPRYASLKLDAVTAWAADWQIPAPRTRKAPGALVQEREAKEVAEKKAALALTGIIQMLTDLPQEKRGEWIERLQSNGTLPADFDLDRSAALIASA